ncbi:hypothetical protein F5876DRAFT_64761, partial [Lentinula aff. lateritia]
MDREYWTGRPTIRRQKTRERVVPVPVYYSPQYSYYTPPYVAPYAYYPSWTASPTWTPTATLYTPSTSDSGGSSDAIAGMGWVDRELLFGVLLSEHESSLELGICWISNIDGWTDGQFLGNDNNNDDSLHFAGPPANRPSCGTRNKRYPLTGAGSFVSVGLFFRHKTINVGSARARAWYFFLLVRNRVQAALNPLSPSFKCIDSTMLFLNRIFRSPSSLSPTLYYAFHFLSLFTLALLINSVITFAEATPVPPEISQQSEIFQFERCTSHKTSGFLFRVGFYDSQSGKSTKSGRGVLVLCIGMNNCFGYTTKTTGGGGGTSATGTQHPNGLVIHTTPQRRTDNSAIGSGIYRRLPNITPNCDKFNSWSGQNHEKTLVDVLMSIADLQNLLTKLDATVTIDSQVSYILAILHYLHSKGMIKTYDKSQIETFLNSSQSITRLPWASRLSWGFRGSKRKQTSSGKWMLSANVKLPKETMPFLCFGFDHCFGLKSDDMIVRDIKPAPKSNSVTGTHNTLYPSFNLQKFKEQLGAPRTSFLARLTAQSQN